MMDSRKRKAEKEGRKIEQGGLVKWGREFLIKYVKEGN